MRETTKKKIFFASLDLFSKYGFNGVSIRDITKEVGIKESSLYNHFSNKEEILENILIFFRKDFLKLLPPVESLDELLQKKSVDSFLKVGHENFKKFIQDEMRQKMWRILQIEQYRSSLAREIILEDLFGKTIEYLEFVFSKLIQYKKIPPIDPKILAIEYQYPVFSMLTEYSILKFDGKDTTEIEARLDKHIEFFLCCLNVGIK